MPRQPSLNPIQFVQGAPVLHVPDVQATVAYYKGVLGFVSDFGNEEYAVVWRDNSAVHFVRGERSPAGVHLFQWVKNVDALHAEVKSRRAAVTCEPVDRPYGIRDFSVLDPNGVLVVFGQDIETGQAAAGDGRDARPLNGGVSH